LLSASQLATINQTISSSLLQTIALPPAKRDTPAARTFLASYAKDTAIQVLQGLIWEPQSTLSKDDKLIRKQVLILAEKLASRLDIQKLLDLSIVYASTNISQLQSIFTAAVQSNTNLRTVEVDLVPAFTQLLTPAQGLYAIRKTAHSLASFLAPCPPDLLRPFAHSKPFIIALASIYDQGLASIAHSYGGLSVLRNALSREPDEWEPIWVATKVSLMDSFHLILNTLLLDVSSASGRALAAEAERTFDIVFALLELPSSSSPSEINANVTPIPFLDRPLLTDYQHAYSLSQTLASALRNAAEKDARLDLLESTLQSLDSESSKSNPGVLKILLRTSGVPPGIDNIGNGSRVRSTLPAAPAINSKGKDKGKGKARVLTTDPYIEIKIAQVLDILPEHPPEYIRVLLEHPPLRRNPEKVVEALLEGTAPGPEELEKSHSELVSVDHGKDDVEKYVRERRNVFDNEVMDVGQLRIGKKRYSSCLLLLYTRVLIGILYVYRQDESTVLHDRTFIEQMKANILRMAEAISDDEEDNEELEFGGGGKKSIVLAYDDEDIDGASNVKIGGDGEESEDGEDDEEGEGVEGAIQKTQTPETILELAYIRDPKLFDRDAGTRRSKAREQLREQTGMYCLKFYL
jgi:activating signal cointegrator complex subunit 2